MLMSKTKGKRRYTAPSEQRDDRTGNRNRRRGALRAYTESLLSVTQEKRREARASYEADIKAMGGQMPARPKTRGDCVRGVRPCPWVGCAYNLYLDVNPANGSLKYNNGEGVEPGDVPANLSCALDIADRGAHTLQYVGWSINTTREWSRIVEGDAMGQLRLHLRVLNNTRRGGW